jgi:hypothetical protein
VLSGALAAIALALVFVGGAAARRTGSLPKLTIALNGKSVKVGGSKKSGAVEVDTTVTTE